MCNEGLSRELCGRVRFRHGVCMKMGVFRENNHKRYVDYFSLDISIVSLFFCKRKFHLINATSPVLLIGMYNGSLNKASLTYLLYIWIFNYQTLKGKLIEARIRKSLNLSRNPTKNRVYLIFSRSFVVDL